MRIEVLGWRKTGEGTAAQTRASRSAIRLVVKLAPLDNGVDRTLVAQLAAVTPSQSGTYYIAVDGAVGK